MDAENYHIIDAHSHLWMHQSAVVNGLPVRPLTNGRVNFLGEERQMLPPWILDGHNTAEIFLSNMDYAQVSAAVVVQELIDGNQNDYLLQVASDYPGRFFVTGMPDFDAPDLPSQARQLHSQGFRGISVPAHRLRLAPYSPELLAMYAEMERLGMILSITLGEDKGSAERFERAIVRCPDLKVAIGHFGMVTTPHWLDQIRLARYPNVYIESGGITWLFNSEFYPFPSAVEAIRRAADEVGIDKLMWGSDYPRTITAITYRMSFDFILKSNLLTDSEKHAFLSDNARRFYGFGDLVTLPYIKNMSE